MNIKHKTEIFAWAEGEQIQSRMNDNDVWHNVTNPTFDNDQCYRVKPEQELIHGVFYKILCCDVKHVMSVMIYDVHYDVFINFVNKLTKMFR